MSEISESADSKVTAYGVLSDAAYADFGKYASAPAGWKAALVERGFSEGEADSF